MLAAKLKLWNPRAPLRVEEFELPVDTGMMFSWIARERLVALGIPSIGRQTFRASDGTIFERDLAAGVLAAEGRVAGATVVMAEPGDREVIGWLTIGGLGLAVDEAQQKLAPTIGWALAAA